MTAWRAETGPLPQLPGGLDATSIYVPPRIRAPDDWPGPTKHAALWVNAFLRGKVRDDVDYPRVVAKIWRLPREISVFVDEPVYLNRQISLRGDQSTEAAVGAVRDLLSNWPAIDAVHVENLGASSVDLTASLNQAGIDSTLVPAEARDITARRRTDEEDGVAWRVWLSHRKQLRGFGVDFGDDVAALVELLASVSEAGTLVLIDAPDPDDFATVTALLDARDSRWRRDHTPDDTPLVSQRCESGGLAAQLTVDGVGWITLHLEVVSHEVNVTLSGAGPDELDALLRAVEYVSTAIQPVVLNLDFEPPFYRFFLIPSGKGTIRLEVWEDPQQADLAARDGQLRARWLGPSRALLDVVVQAARSVVTVNGVDWYTDRWCHPPSAVSVDT